jgi:hypothetical protein
MHAQMPAQTILQTRLHAVHTANPLLFTSHEKVLAQGRMLVMWLLFNRQ